MKDKICKIKIGDNFEKDLEDFKKNLMEEEQIVSTCVANNYLIICIRQMNNSSRNLLLEEAQNNTLHILPKIIKP